MNTPNFPKVASDIRAEVAAEISRDEATFADGMALARHLARPATLAIATLISMSPLTHAADALLLVQTMRQRLIRDHWQSDELDVICVELATQVLNRP